MTFGSQVDQPTATQMVHRALDAGVNHIDTANAYNLGASEEIVAQALGSLRKEVILATKVFNPMSESPMDRGLSAAAIHKAIDDSLRRLRTDYVDLYYLHQPDWTVPVEESLGAMNDLVAAGKVRHIAVSNYAAWQIADIGRISDRHGWQPVHVSQVMYNLISRHLDEEYAAFAATYNLTNIVYNPLAGGLLTGKHRMTDTPRPGTRFTTQMYLDRYWNARQFDAVEQLDKIAGEAGMSLVELSYRWLLAQEAVDAVLVGASSPDQLEANLSASSVPVLSADVLAQCDEVWKILRGPVSRYNR
jgi:aryl-alcohol dehydrogenase-like predicted oxidoreductase